MSRVIAFMIQQGTTLFNIPPKLATDIRAYLSERERRRLSPKKEVYIYIYMSHFCWYQIYNFIIFQSMSVQICQAHVTNWLTFHCKSLHALTWTICCVLVKFFGSKYIFFLEFLIIITKMRHWNICEDVNKYKFC